LTVNGTVCHFGINCAYLFLVIYFLKKTIAKNFLLSRPWFTLIQLILFLSFLYFQQSSFADCQWRLNKGLAPFSNHDYSKWFLPEFNDSDWQTGVMPFFYNENLTGTALNDMRGNYSYIFLRKKFLINNLLKFSSIELEIYSDDGCIVWLNGQELFRYNLPQGDISSVEFALSEVPEPIHAQYVSIDPKTNILFDGENTIAVQAFNCNRDDFDFAIDIKINLCSSNLSPFIVDQKPKPNSLLQSLEKVEVLFNETVYNIEPNDMLVNGKPALAVTPIDSWRYEFLLPELTPGEVQITWNPSNRIHNAIGNPLRTNSWKYYICPTNALSLIISEFMADNSKTIRDEDGDYSDWIEIFNPSTNTVNLDGWALTDDKNNLAKWKFPALNIEPGAYLLVFASGKNRTNQSNYLHTNFSLDKDGEYLGLVDPFGNIVSDFSPRYPAQQKDISFGRLPENPNIAGFYLRPTPGNTNSIMGNGFTDEVQFSKPGGHFTDPFLLELKTASSNAVIYYTIDGSTPCLGSPVFTNPIAITPTNIWIIKAMAWAPDNLPSPIATEVYIPADPDLNRFTSSLPVVVINQLPAGILENNVDQIAYTTIYTTTTNTNFFLMSPDIRTLTKINTRGTSSVDQPKKSYNLEWITSEGAELNLQTLGMPSDSEWVLYAPNNFDTPLIHNAFMFDLSNQIGRYAPRYKFVELFLNNGSPSLNASNYCGIYLLVEKIKRSPNRVNVEKLEPEHTNEPTISGGYIFKKDWVDSNDVYFITGKSVFIFVYPNSQYICQNERIFQKNYLIKYLDSLSQTLNSSDPYNETNGYPAFIDTDSWIDFHLLNTLAMNVDALYLSTYFYKPRNGKVFCGPIWDFDRSMDSRDDPRDDNPFSWIITNELGSNDFGFLWGTWWTKLFQDNNFWQKYIDRYQTLRKNEFSISNLWQMIDSLAQVLKEAQPREFAKWGSFNAPRNNSYEYEIYHMKEWLSNRVSFLDSNFLPPPTFSHSGGLVPAGFKIQLINPQKVTILYTVDGSDPRLPNGLISPKARTLKSDFLIVGTNLIICARTYDPNHVTSILTNEYYLPSPWSGPTMAEFSVLPGTVSSEDSDSDGLLDWWESYFGLNPLSASDNDGPDADPDLDGMSNLQEFLAGTDPLDNQSCLKLNISFSNNRVLLNFNATDQLYYKILYSEDLNASAWFLLKEYPPQNQNSNLAINLNLNSFDIIFFKLVGYQK